MEQSEQKVTVILGSILHAPLINAWGKMCKKYGVDEQCLNDGKADIYDTIEISLDDAGYYGLED